MDKRHDVVVLGNDVNHLVCEIPRMARHKPDPRNANLGGFFQQSREVDAFVQILAVRVDVLSKQRHFLVAGIFEFLHFF